MTHESVRGLIYLQKFTNKDIGRITHGSDIEFLPCRNGPGTVGNRVLELCQPIQTFCVLMTLKRVNVDNVRANRVVIVVRLGPFPRFRKS